MDIFVQLLFAALGGGLVVKLLDIAYRENLRKRDKRGSSRKFVEENLDPVLKSADELFGKLRALATDDFRALRHIRTHEEASLESIGLLYLLAKFWASVETFRHKGLTVSITLDDRGQQLGHFLDALESRKIRIADRLSQRATAEMVLNTKNNHEDMDSFTEFVKSVEANGSAQQWTEPIVQFLMRMEHTYERQKLLTYGVVVHAMIDTLDPRHQVCRERTSYPSKLSKKSWRDIKYRIFGRYLTFVKHPEKYFGPPKRRP